MALRTFLVSASGPAWQGLRQALRALPQVTLVGDAVCLAEVRAQIGVLQPDVVICPLLVEGQSALSLLREVRAGLPRARLVVIGGRFPRADVVALASLPVDGAWTWDDLEHRTFPGARDAVLDGPFAVYNRGMVRAMVESLVERRPERLAAGMDERERAVLARLAAGSTREQIAAAERLTPRSVDRVIATLKRKLDAPSLFVLGMRAARLGLVPPP